MKKPILKTIYRCSIHSSFWDWNSESETGEWMRKNEHFKSECLETLLNDVEKFCATIPDEYNVSDSEIETIKTIMFE